MITPFKILDTPYLKVYGCHIHQLCDEQTSQHLLDTLPLILKERIVIYKDWKDRQSRIAGKLLLSWLLNEIGANEFADLHQLKFGIHNKPYFDGDLEFNIAHSGDVVICGVSQKKVIGVDIELVRPIEIVEFTAYFLAEDIYTINNNSQPTKMFYQLWTRREALSKALGTGVMMNTPALFYKGKCIIDQREFELTNIAVIDGYIAALAIEL